MQNNQHPQLVWPELGRKGAFPCQPAAFELSTRCLWAIFVDAALATAQEMACAARLHLVDFVAKVDIAIDPALAAGRTFSAFTMLVLHEGFSFLIALN